MGPKERTAERRRRKRLSVRHGVFALLWPHFSVVGRVLDISDDGLSFCYVGSEDRTTGSSRLSVLSADSSVQLMGLQFETVCDFSAPSDFSCGDITERRCGVRFTNLADEHKATIRGFVKAYAEGETVGLGADHGTRGDAEVAGVC